MADTGSNMTLYIKPQDFAITVISYSEIDLSWVNPEAQFPTSIQIQRKAAGGVYSVIKTIAANLESYSDTTCSQSVNYYYRIRYYTNSSNYSEWTDEADDWTYPKPPSGQAVSFDGVVATLSWTNEGIYDYIYYSTVGHTTPVPLDGNTESVDIVMPTEATFYGFGITAYVTASDKTSEQATATGTSGINKPTNLVANCPTTTSCDLTWDDNSSVETGYEIYQDDVLIDTIASDSESYSMSGLSESTEYTFGVKAITATAGSLLVTVVITTGAMPDADPVIGTATKNGHLSIAVTWTDTCTNAEGFYVWRSPDPDDSDYINIATVLPDVETYTDESVNSNTIYYYKIQAYNNSGVSGLSASANATTDPNLDPPTDIVATVLSSTQIRLDFTNNSPDASYLYVEKKTSGTWDTPGSYTNGDATTYTVGSLAEGVLYSFRIRAKLLTTYGSYSVPITVTLAYSHTASISIDETYVGIGSVLNVATSEPTNLLDCYMITKPIDYTEQDPNMENFWKVLDRIHLDFVDLYPDTPVTVYVSADGGYTWDREYILYLGVGDGKNKCYDFWIEPITAQYHVIKLQSVDNVTGFCWTGFDIYYEPRSRVFELGWPGV